MSETIWVSDFVYLLFRDYHQMKNRNRNAIVNIGIDIADVNFNRKVYSWILKSDRFIEWNNLNAGTY